MPSPFPNWMVIYPLQEKTRSSFLSLFTSPKVACAMPWVDGQLSCVVTVVGAFVPTLSTISNKLVSVM